jgi:alpha-tubulin suppressor-like RCC1 family protein
MRSRSLFGLRDARKLRRAEVRQLIALLSAALSGGCNDAFKDSDLGVVVEAKLPVPDSLARTQDTLVEAVVETKDGKAIEGANLLWESSDDDVIEISTTGLKEFQARLSALRAGEAEITATVTGGIGEFVPQTVLRDTVRVSERWIAVSVGRNFSCGINVDSTAYCWGSDLQPSSVPGLFDFAPKHLEVGHATACVVVLIDLPLCWGQNALGEIGNGDQDRHPIPVEGAINRAVDALVGLSAGGTFFCGNFHRPPAFFIQCWGNSAFLQLGVPSPSSRCRFNFMDYPCRKELEVEGEPLRIPIHAASVDAGESHACAVEEDPRPGLMHCWGAAGTGQLGASEGLLLDCPIQDGSTLQCGSPALVDPNLHFISVTAGWDIFEANSPLESAEISWLGEGHTCAIAEDLTAFCWGKNDHGQLGAGSDSTCDRAARAPSATVQCRATPLPVQAPTPGTFKALSAGSEHTCGIMTNDRVYCWGNNARGQLGDDGALPQVQEPTPIASERPFWFISAGPDRTCGLTLDQGKIYCWGDDTYFTPTLVGDPR